MFPRVVGGLYFALCLLFDVVLSCFPFPLLVRTLTQPIMTHDLLSLSVPPFAIPNSPPAWCFHATAMLWMPYEIFAL